MKPNPLVLMLTLLALIGAAQAQSPGQTRPAPDDDHFGALKLPDSWRQRFWSSPAGKKLLGMDARAVADLVPTQAGLRFCRCPACGADERSEPLSWTLEQPDVLTCVQCKVVVPNQEFPAKVKDQVPDEAVEVLPGVIHHYPYHPVEESKALYPDERLYLKARIDYERRKFLAKAALYAALHSRAGNEGEHRHAAELACTILLKFARVYPKYAIHYDQPGRPKSLQPAQLLPPYRQGYQTARWEWTGSQEVALNLVMAYSLLKSSAAWAEAGMLLGDRHPNRTIERDLFHAMAEFSRAQPRELSEGAIAVDRGLIAVARVLKDRELAAEARRRFAELTRHGFYHDGHWKAADADSHQRVMNMLDGWVARELGDADPFPSSSRVIAGEPPTTASILELARQAGRMMEPPSATDEVRLASLSVDRAQAPRNEPLLFGGAGIARLAMGEGTQSLEVEIRGQDSYGQPRFQRLAMRVRVGGQPVLDDFDEERRSSDGWELATPSHNLVVVDGLNQREAPALAGQPVAGSNLLFHAVDPDFQVVSFDDPRAYPLSTTRYRQTIVLSDGKSARYALAVFEVHGGLRHDQVFHSAAHRSDGWRLSEKLTPTSASLLPASIRFIPGAPREQGRWFVQSLGEFQTEGFATLNGPTVAQLSRPKTSDATAADSTPGVRLRLLGDMPATGYVATCPQSNGNGSPSSGTESEARPSLIVQRRSARGETLRSTFVTLIEPLAAGSAPLTSVRRLDAPPGVIAVMVRTASETEYLLINLEPGSTQRVGLPGRGEVSFDGLALRVRESSLALAGGSYAEAPGQRVSNQVITGNVTGSVRKLSQRGRGWFVTPQTLEPDPSLSGRTLIIDHGDGSSRAWTLDSLERLPEGTRLHVREEPGFTVDSADGPAHYYQFPGVTAAGPHRFRVARIAR